MFKYYEPENSILRCKVVWDMRENISSIVIYGASLLLLLGAWLNILPKTRGVLNLLGILGTLCMVLGQMYSFRKRTRFLHSWKIKNALEQHTALGIAGPMLILAHTDLRFGGVAGKGFALMLIVFASGFIGRHIYRRVPTTEKKNEIEKLKKELEHNLDDKLARIDEPEEFIEMLERQINEKLAIEKEIKSLEKRLAHYDRMKDLLSKWKSIHTPLTMTFFIIISLHIYSVYYYGGGV